MTRQEVEADIIQTLKQIYDPEMPVNIYDMGLIYAIELLPNGEKWDATIVMTLTSPACPVAESLYNNVVNLVSSTPALINTKVDLTFEPPWDWDMMSEDGKLVMNMH